MYLSKRFNSEGGTGILLVACLFQGCAARTTQPVAGTRKLLFVDQSLSAAGARESWLNAGLGVIGALGPGDGMWIFAVHGRTAEAPPLYDADIPVVRPRPTSRQLAEYVNTRARVVADASSALRKAFATENPSRSTDVFSVVDRARIGVDGRPEKVWIFVSFRQGCPSQGRIWQSVMRSLSGSVRQRVSPG